VYVIQSVNMTLDTSVQAAGGRAKRRPWRYSTEDIAAAAGVCPSTVRRAIAKGRLNPASVVSLVAFVAPGLGWRRE